MKKRERITTDDLMNWWLERYFNTNIEGVIRDHPNEIHSPEWYRFYEVTQEQHDEWYKWAIGAIAKSYGWSAKEAKRQFQFPYLNTSPNVLRENKE